MQLPPPGPGAGRLAEPAGGIRSLRGRRFALKDEGDGDPAPTTLGGTPVIMALQVDDADAVAGAMLAAGATVIYPVNDQPYGERGGRLADPYGHQWMVSQRIEELTPAEIQRRVGGGS